MMRLAMALLLLALLGGCARREAAPGSCSCAPEQALDQQLMLLLASARALHHQADLQLQQGEVEQAIATIRKLLELDLDSRWPEAEEARLDASARLAKLLLGRGEEQPALEAAEQAIAGSTRESFYLANLHSVVGEILEARSRRLQKEGAAEARETAREAIAAFERSISINKRLQQKLLKQEGR